MGDALTDGYMRGQMVGQRRALNTAQANLAQANADLAYAQQVIWDYELQIATLNRQLAEARLALLVKEAHAEGIKAYRDEFKKAHPNSPVLADSGRRYKDGDRKLNGTLAYEAAFDRILRDARISDPTKYRAN